MVVLVVSVTLVAVMVIVCCVVMADGAVYRPVADSVPTDGFIDQVTELLLLFATVAVNCCVADGSSDTVAGVRETPTGGVRVMAVVAVLVLS